MQYLPRAGVKTHFFCFLDNTNMYMYNVNIGMCAWYTVHSRATLEVI